MESNVPLTPPARPPLSESPTVFDERQRVKEFNYCVEEKEMPRVGRKRQLRVDVPEDRPLVNFKMTVFGLPFPTADQLVQPVPPAHLDAHERAVYTALPQHACVGLTIKE